MFCFFPFSDPVVLIVILCGDQKNVLYGDYDAIETQIKQLIYMQIEEYIYIDFHFFNAEYVRSHPYYCIYCTLIKLFF